MEIRRLTESDASSLWHLRLHALETDPNSFGESAEELRITTVEEYGSRLRSGGEENFIFGAFDGDKLIGMTGFYRERALKRKHKGGVWGVFVSSSWRGTGVGRALLLNAIQAAKALPGLCCIVLMVAKTQVAAKCLYESLGFRSFGTEPRSLKVGDRYIDEDHMQLELDASSR
jgi:ribosomal protein S18 acetylase RimI-like enzyme